MSVDGFQLVVDGNALVKGLLKMSVHYVDGVLNLLNVVIDGVLLQDERLLDANQVKGILADGVNFGRDKNISFLSKK